MSVLCKRASVDYTFIREFIKDEVVEKYTPSERNAVLHQLLEEFAEVSEKSDASDNEYITMSLKMMVNPMLEKVLKPKSDSDKDLPSEILEIVDDAFVNKLVADVFAPSDSDEKGLYTDTLLIELLQLSTLLIRYAPKAMINHRKELIKFGWNHLKRENSSSKQWAFVNISYFLQAYQAPEKIILQVFVALLKAHQPEQKDLVTEALDALTPALPLRLPLGDHKYPIWIRYTKKSLNEDGHSLPQLVHIWSLIVRHAKLFYTSRAQFVPQMVNLLSRLGLPTSSSHANRKLSVDLVELIINWENDRLSGAQPQEDVEPSTTGKRKATESPEKEEDFTPSRRGKKSTKKTKKEETESKSPGRSTRASRSTKQSKEDDDDDDMASDLPETEKLKSMPSIGQIDEGFKLSPAMEEIVVNFLVRMKFITAEGKDPETKALNSRTLDLLSNALALWPSVRIKFTFIDKLLTLASQAQRDPTSTLITGLSVLKIAMKTPGYDFITENIEQAVRLIEPCHGTADSDTHSLLGEVIQTAFECNKDSGRYDDALAKLKQEVSTQHEKCVADAIVAKSAPNTETANTSLACILKVIECQAAFDPSTVDEYLSSLMKVLARLTHELNTASAAGELQQSHPKRGQAPPEIVAPEYGGVAYCMIKCINVISLRVINSGSEQKQIFLRLLLQLINDKATHGDVLMAILDAMVAWTDTSALGEVASEETNVGSLNAKETVLFLSKLAQLTRMGLKITQTDVWEEKLLGAIYKLCVPDGKQDPALRSEVFLKVERTHLLGLRTRRLEIRKKFFALYHGAVGKTLFQRLQYILTIQDWDAMADTFWLMQGLDLILSTLAEDERIMLAPNSALVSSLLPFDADTKQPVPVRPSQRTPRRTPPNSMS